MKHLPPLLIACGLGLVLWRPEWVSVAAFALLVVVAAFAYSERDMEADRSTRLVESVNEHQTRLLKAEDTLAAYSKRLAEVELSANKAHEALQRVGPAKPRGGL